MEGNSYILFLFFFVLWWFARPKHENIVDLRLEEYTITRENLTQLVHLRGRKAGLVGWVLQLFNFQIDYEIVVGSRDVIVRHSGTFSEGQIYLPIPKVITAIYGYTRPRGALFVAIGFWFMGLSSLFFTYSPNVVSSVVMLVIGGLIFWFLYWQNRTIEIRMSTGDGMFWGYSYRLGTAGTIEKARETTKIVNELIHDSAV